MNHVAHMIRFHPEKVFEEKVQRIIHEALRKMVTITKSREKRRLKKLFKKQDYLDCNSSFACCETCHRFDNHDKCSQVQFCPGPERQCRHLNWLFTWPTRREFLEGDYHLLEEDVK